MRDHDDLRATLDEYTLVFGEDLDELELRENGGEPVGSWGLAAIVRAMLDVMETDRECDDMLDLSRHLAYLSKIIRKTVVDQQTATRGEP